MDGHLVEVGEESIGTAANEDTLASELLCFVCGFELNRHTAEILRVKHWEGYPSPKLCEVVTFKQLIVLDSSLSLELAESLAKVSPCTDLVASLENILGLVVAILDGAKDANLENLDWISGICHRVRLDRVAVGLSGLFIFYNAKVQQLFE